MTELRLKKRQERRVLSGHDWVFSNEIDTSATPLKTLEPGQPVSIVSSNGRFLAHAYANPHSLISARITSRVRECAFTEDVLRERLATALALRERCFPHSCYRLVHGEGDHLPGLTIDRYGDVLMVQINTAGMQQFQDSIIDVLKTLCSPRAVCLQNDSAYRALEQLPQERLWVYGQATDTLEVTENDRRFVIPAQTSQKTGWFYDHRESRAALERWVNGRRVLDVYSYLGGFGVNAACYGAAHVLALDSSQHALTAAQENAAINGVQDRFSVRCGDAVELMRQLAQEGERYDVIILDPPAFIKRRKDHDAGLQHYGLNNRLALRLLSEDGVIFSASCSQPLSQAALVQQMRRNLPKDRAMLQVLAPLSQAADHPVHAAMPETEYLCGVIARLI